MEEVLKSRESSCLVRRRTWKTTWFPPPLPQGERAEETERNMLPLARSVLPYSDVCYSGLVD